MQPLQNKEILYFYVKFQQMLYKSRTTYYVLNGMP